MFKGRYCREVNSGGQVRVDLSQEPFNGGGGNREGVSEFLEERL